MVTVGASNTFRWVTQAEILCRTQPTTNVKKTKRNFALIVLATLSSFVRAQIEDIALGSDSSFVLDRVYAGILGANNFSIDSVYRSGFSNVRVGVSTKLRLTKVASIVAFMAEDMSTSGNSIGGTGFFLKLYLSKSLYLALGQGPQVGTFLHRAHPATAGGQFETFTHRSIPGAAPGARLVKTIGKTDILASVAAVDGRAEGNLGASFAGFAGNVWWNEKGAWGSAMTYKSKLSKTILVIRDDLWASTFAYNLPNKYILYTDAGITTENYSVVRAEFGMLRTFEAKKYVKGLVGLGYAYELRCVRGYIFVTL